MGQCQDTHALVLARPLASSGHTNRMPRVNCVEVFTIRTEARSSRIATWSTPAADVTSFFSGEAANERYAAPPPRIKSTILNPRAARAFKMDSDDIVQRLDAAETRIFALTLCLATALKHAPQAVAELHALANHLDDAPPVAVSDARLAAVASHIRVVLGAEWDDSAGQSPR